MLVFEEIWFVHIGCSSVSNFPNTNCLSNFGLGGFAWFLILAGWWIWRIKSWEEMMEFGSRRQTGFRPDKRDQTALCADYEEELCKLKETSAKKEKHQDLFILLISLTLSAQAVTLSTIILSITFNGAATDVRFLRNLQISFHIRSQFSSWSSSQNFRSNSSCLWVGYLYCQEMIIILDGRTWIKTSKRVQKGLG